MNDLNISATQSSPAVRSDGAEGTLEMRGDSYPENSWEFYAPILSWIEDYLSNESAALRLELNLIYLNTSSVKAMMDMLDLLEETHKRGQQVAVNWYYDGENERIAELIDEFREDYTFPFQILRNDA